MATALVTSSIEQSSAGRTLVTLSRGIKLVAHLDGELKQFWAAQNVAALASYLEGRSVLVTCVDSPLYSLCGINEHAAWVDAGVSVLFLHGHEGRVEAVHVQDHGAEVHILSRDFLALGDFHCWSTANAMASALSTIANVDIPECASAFDFFESGHRSPEFDRVICLKDFGHSSAEGYFCPVVIGRY